MLLMESKKELPQLFKLLRMKPPRNKNYTLRQKRSKKRHRKSLIHFMMHAKSLPSMKTRLHSMNLEPNWIDSELPSILEIVLLKKTIHSTLLDRPLMDQTTDGTADTGKSQHAKEETSRN